MSFFLVFNVIFGEFFIFYTCRCDLFKKNLEPSGAMEGNSGESGSDYFDCVTDRSGSSSEELEYQLGPNVATLEVDLKGKSAGDEVQRIPIIRRFRRMGNSRRQIENTKTYETTVTGADSEVKRTQEKQTGDGYELCGYELRAPPCSTHALKRLSMDAVVDRKEDEKSQSMRSKVLLLLSCQLHSSCAGL